LRWPGVLAEPTVAPDELATRAHALVGQALAELGASRAREGAKLAIALEERCAAIETQVARVAPRIPALHAAYVEKLAARLREARLDPDQDRLKQELALFATKIDVAEEVQRLTAHVAEVRRVLKAGGATGKRLDFLMQELHREANTLGSKSVDAELSQASLELKVLIEQMREQVQNLE
ncbi:MAG: YicC/YloC family endoribonuclease, partial [Betaproteobacteria bacterium]